jgi:photosystem II stability/assembly factor-like uncharacterized protein
VNDAEIAGQRGVSADVVYRIRTELGDSPESIAAMPDSALQRAVLKLEHPDRAGRRIEHELAALVDDGGDIAEGALAHAHRQAVELRAAKGFGLVAGLPSGSPPGSGFGPLLAPSAGLNGGAGWVELGPDNIGGRTRAIVIDPVDTDRIYAAGVGGGVWRSSDQGQSWLPTDDLMGNLAICSLAMDPTDRLTILAGSGEGFFNGGAIRGDGIFLTTDGGDSWIRLDSTENDARFHYVNSLAYSPDGAVILAATNSGILRSVDGGASWSQATPGLVGNVVFHPTDPSRAIAGRLQVGEVLFSGDGGATWQAANRPPGMARRIQVCYAVADPDITYASVEAVPSRIWRSSDGGQSYVAMGTMSSGISASYLGQQGWYDNAIWAGDPTDQDLVIVGGIDLWRSTDGGDNLTQISTWWSPDSAHADHHVIVSDPGYNGTTNRRLYFGNDGGVYRADDGRGVGNNASPPYTNGWTSLNQGYAVTQFYYGAAHIGTNTIVGGTQDNGTLTRTPAGGNSWAKAYGGDGGACASDPRDAMVWYGEYVYLNVFRNTNGGASSLGSDPISGNYWDGFDWRWKNEPFVISDSRNGAAQFIAPFLLDPNDADRLLGGARSLWLTTDPLTPNTQVSGPTWRTIKAPIGNLAEHNISALAVADGNSDLIVVGHGNGRLYRADDGTATNPAWTRIDDNGGGIGVNRQCLDLTIDPDDHDVIYATFGGYTSGNIWKTTDGGQTWADISSGLPDVPVRAATLHPQRSHWVYVATDIGVYASEDGGQDWSATNEGPADVACRDLFWLGAELVVATHGRGMFQIDLTIANAFPAPRLEYLGAEDITTPDGDFTRYRLRVANADRYPDSLFRPSPDLPPCGTNSNSSRTWVDIFDGTTNQRLYGFCALGGAADLDGLWFALARGATPPATVHLELRDRRCGQIHQSNTVDIGPPATGPETREVTNIGRDGRGRLDRVAGSWGEATVAEAVADIRAGRIRYVIGSGGDRVSIGVVNGRSGPYLRSTGDGRSANNLGDLPPIGG